MKKILSIFLANLMILASVPFVFATESYEITHQPVDNEFYVETNDENATYQWYEVTEGYTIDSTNASPFDPNEAFGSYDEYKDEAYYSESRGWIPTYRQLSNGIYEMLYFGVSLKKGETVTFEFSSEKLTIVAFQYNFSESGYPVVDGKTATYTVEKDGVYYLEVYGLELASVTVSSDGKSYTAVEGETSAQLSKNEEDKVYACSVTFSDGTVVLSDEVAGHKHTSTELTCMGYKCSGCGEFYGEEAADVHSFTSYTQTMAPGCAEKGAEIAECDYGCGKSDVREIPATNHVGTLLQVEGKDATCTENGYEAYEYCTACTYTTYKEIPAAHTIVKVEAQAPSCSHIGWEAYEYCSECDYTTYDEISELEHTPVEEVRENKVDPKCGVAGSYDLVVYCGVCDVEIFRITIAVAALTHKDADGDYACDHGCGYEFAPTPDEPADPDTPDEPADPDTPDEPAGDNACDICGKVHNGFFSDVVCFFTMIFSFIADIFR